MGWSGGSTIMSDIITVLKKHVKDEAVRKKIYKFLIPTLESEDADTLDECVGEDKAFDAVWEKMYPDEPEDEDESELY